MRKQMINRSAVSAFVLISTLMLGFSPFAKADCPANAIKGTWIANGSYWTPVSDVAADIGWFTCKLQINSSGKIRTTKESSCKDERNEDGGYKWQILGNEKLSCFGSYKIWRRHQYRTLRRANERICG